MDFKAGAWTNVLFGVVKGNDAGLLGVNGAFGVGLFMLMVWNIGELEVIMFGLFERFSVALID